MEKCYAWIGLLLAVASACTSEQSRLDSSDNLISGPKNQLHLLTLDLPGTCAQARRKIEARKVPSAPENGLLMMQVMQCQNREANQVNPQETIITVVTFREVTRTDLGDHERVEVQVGYTPLQFTPQTIGAAARQLVQLARLAPAQEPDSVVVRSALGTHSVEAYLEAVKLTTPVIVLLPKPVQGHTLTPALYAAAFTRFQEVP